MRPLLSLALAALLVAPLLAQDTEARAGRPVPKATAVAKAAPVARQPAPVRPEAAIAGSNNATFRPGDLFELRVTGVPSEDQPAFQIQFAIGSDGYINIPYAGQVRAVGLTQSQLERAIAQKLIDAKIFTNPTPIIIVPSIGRAVTVSGEVRAPQRVQWSQSLTLLDAIAQAGGPAEFAGDKIRLVRNQKIEMFSTKVLRKDPTKDPTLLPGDRIEQL